MSAGKTLVIAEIGPNHNGSFERALAMVPLLARAGADVVKFQLGVPELVYCKDAFKAAYQVERDGESPIIEMSRRLQLTRQDHVRLAAACRAEGVRYACTAFDVDSLRFLDGHIELPFFKLPSGEILSVDLIEHMAKRSLPILISTGMAQFQEIGRALDALTAHGNRDVTVLHCVSAYPASPVEINLNVMDELAKRFNFPVGYSDHSIGFECCLAAVAKGASVVEKHVTMDKGLPGPDHKASATIEEFAAMVASIRIIEAALGGHDKVFSEAEKEIRGMARKSIVSRHDLAPGHILTAADVCFKRPGTGISPMDLRLVLGRELSSAVEADRVIRPEDIA